jgi:hypothetical protein
VVAAFRGQRLAGDAKDATQSLMEHALMAGTVVAVPR